MAQLISENYTVTIELTADEVEALITAITREVERLVNIGTVSWANDLRSVLSALEDITLNKQ